jgi:hypothetical protein
MKKQEYKECFRKIKTALITSMNIGKQNIYILETSGHFDQVC